MTIYIIRELQNAQSQQDGEKFFASTLTAAKRKASNLQMFHGTVMTIENENGSRVSVKENGKWNDK